VKPSLEAVRASSGAAEASLAELALALASADALGVPMPVTAAAHATNARAASAGHGAKSCLAKVLAIDEAAGARVSKLAK
jgi:3-hydroxyisobutyrate dehydrogenase-like beta-hydroxyacid dehydrogenase